MKKISQDLHNHYKKTFLKHGANSKGVDWGDKEWAGLLRQQKMLEVIRPNLKPVSLLDVGCGYGALADLINERRLNISYTGLDVVPDMVDAAIKRHPNSDFICGDIMTADLNSYDYIVCNGILTQKLNASTLEMNQFANELIKKMFSHCNIGIAFNVMSTYVNFQKDHLHYRNPSELLAWCMSEMTPNIKLDCSYEQWYEYSLYLYK